MPLGQRGDGLTEIVGASGDETVDAARLGFRVTGIRDEEGGLVAFDDGFRGHHVTQKTLLLLEAGDEFGSILLLKCYVRHVVILRCMGLRAVGSGCPLRQ